MSSQIPLFIAVGGFLGAGKTTAIVRVTERLRANGHRVAIMTNDQASGLVDTAFVGRTADDVAEITGGCFCCRFDRLQQTIEWLVRTQRPDIILAEAVGSCTDLAATVYQPLRQLAMGSVRLGPLSVVVDGPRLRSMRGGKLLPRLPACVAYLFDRQLAEADVLLLNKVDRLSVAERVDLQQHLAAHYPGAIVQAITATSGDGLDQWVACIAETPGAGHRVINLDYDRYAQAESALGWLNFKGSLNVRPGSAEAWVSRVFDEIQQRARVDDIEIAHVKLWLETDEGVVKANLATTDHPPMLTIIGTPSGRARVLLNARVAVAPELLQEWIRRAITVADTATSLTFVWESGEAFRPARPVPLYRLAPPTTA
jgi:G3E family GTPase